MKSLLFLALAILCTPVPASGADADKYLEKLYESMPLPDSLVYPRQWWEANVEKTLQTRSAMGWNVPEREFIHFVLPLRVNNEGLDDFRLEYADELCERVKGLSMADAVLEINHWCHERVTYQPSDGRTSAPMSTIRYGFGRCGEESVVTVAALRAAGIPARQVYTPRWAHTDDNHAWVEAWVDGKWHFLGACEPEPALDMGWFNAAVSRAMLLHTKVAGDYRGPEDVISRNSIYTEINLIRDYVPSRRSEVVVKDASGRPVKGATVDFKIYNYAEYFTVASVQTDKHGKAGLDSGLGDLVVMAYKGNSFGLAKAGSDLTEVVLNHRFGDVFSMDFHIVPPAENPLPANATQEQIAANAERLQKEDSIRAVLHPDVVNRQTIDDFRALGNGDEKMAAAVQTVLGSISEKDLRDVTSDVLEDAVSDISNADRYVLSPRIEIEKLLPFHKEIREGLAGQVKTHQDALEWVKYNIRIVEGRNPQKLRIPPVAVWRSRMCDKASLGIFYVALCRAAGIPARISLQNGNVQVQEDGTWLDVNMERTTARANPRGYLALDTSEAGVNVPDAYFFRFTVSKIENGPCRLLDYESSEEKPSELTPLEAGYYMLVSGTRQPDGSVLSHVQTFNVGEGQTVPQKLVLWPAGDKGEKVGSDGCIVARMAANGEPTTHALRQLEAAAQEINAWGGSVKIYGPSASSLKYYRRFIQSIDSVSFEVDSDGSVLESLEGLTGGNAGTLPYVSVNNAQGTSVFFSQGYNTSLRTGIARMLEPAAPEVETPELKKERMDWFAHAKLGIFIHWGIYSRGDWSESWPIFNKRVTLDEYMAQKADFTAAKYNPEQWVSLIRESGARYTVITSKHHDGVALWDTRAGSVSTVKSCAAGRDVLTPFVDEVRRQGGLRLGLYYSLIDWPHEDYPNIFREGPAKYDIKENPEKWQRFLDFNDAQMKELDETYHPDLYWFDGDWEFSSEDWRAPEIVKKLRGYNPDVIINSRIQGNGDYATPELGVPVVRPKEQWWETCMTINDSWAFRKQDTGYKSNITLLHMFVNCMSLGGNLLLDIGPRADGTIPEEEVNALKYIGRWIKKHEEAVYSTRAGIPDGHVQGYTTLNEAGDILYVYLPYVPTESVEVKGLKTRIKKVRVVGTDRTLSWNLYNDIDWSEMPGVYYIDVPKDVADEAVTVLAIELEGPLKLYRGSGQVISFND